MAKKDVTDHLLIGAHTSAAGGVHNALLEGKRIGATTIQFFTSNQKQWKGRQFTSDNLAEWRAAREETGLSHLMSHDSYLINLGASNPEVLTKSHKAFREEIERCVALELSYLNFHPCAAVTDSVEHCLERIVESLLKIEDAVEGSSLRLLIETTAGQGTIVGRTFEELAYLIENTKDKLPIGICIDTCHIFAAGYDVRTAEAWEETLQEFDRLIGLEHLYAFSGARVRKRQFLRIHNNINIMNVHEVVGMVQIAAKANVEYVEFNPTDGFNHVILVNEENCGQFKRAQRDIIEECEKLNVPYNFLRPLDMGMADRLVQITL